MCCGNREVQHRVNLLEGHQLIDGHRGHTQSLGDRLSVCSIKIRHGDNPKFIAIRDGGEVLIADLSETDDSDA